MLAEIGFFVTGVCFAMFAYTFKTIVIKKTKLELDQFAWAYFFLALALVTWGIAVYIGGDLLLRNSVYVGDFFLLCGTLLMADILLGENNRFWTALAAVGGLFLLNYRIGHYAAQPHMDGQVLLFNVQTPVAIVLILIFAGVWLPASINVAKQITSRIKKEGLFNIYALVYAAATLAAVALIFSNKVLNTVLSLAVLIACFLIMLTSNVLAEASVRRSPGSKHGGKRK